MQTQPPMRLGPPYTSNPSELGDYDEQEEFFLLVLECDEFWWNEEEKHELF